MALALLVGVVANAANAADTPTSLWSVSNGKQRVLIGGTMHALQASDYPLPAQFDQAYRLADQLVFETDRGRTLTRAGRNMMGRVGMIRGGANLQDKLRPQTWTMLHRFLDANDIPVDRIKHFRPGMVTVVLPMMAKRTGTAASDGVDAHYLDRAEREGKPVTSFETLYEQMVFFATLGDDDPDSAVLHALEEASQDNSMHERVTAAWRRGDLDWIGAHALTAIQAYPRIYRALLVERNKVWTEKIAEMLTTSATELVLVGVLHLAGDESLLNMLAARGFSVSRYAQ